MFVRAEIDHTYKNREYRAGEIYEVSPREVEILRTFAKVVDDDVVHVKAEQEPAPVSTAEESKDKADAAAPKRPSPFSPKYSRRDMQAEKK